MPKWIEVRLDALEEWVQDKEFGWSEFFHDRPCLRWWAEGALNVLGAILIAVFLILLMFCIFAVIDTVRDYYWARVQAEAAVAYVQGFVPRAGETLQLKTTLGTFTRTCPLTQGSEAYLTIKDTAGPQGITWDDAVFRTALSTSGVRGDCDSLLYLPPVPAAPASVMGVWLTTTADTLADLTTTWEDAVAAETMASRPDACPDTITLYPESPLKYVKWKDPNTGEEVTLTLPKKLPKGAAIDTAWAALSQGLRWAALHADALGTTAKQVPRLGAVHSVRDGSGYLRPHWGPAEAFADYIHRLELDCARLAEHEAEKVGEAH